jgi:hypothetical protein
VEVPGLSPGSCNVPKLVVTLRRRRPATGRRWPRKSSAGPEWFTSRGSSGTESLLLGQPRCHDAGGWIFRNGRPGARRRRAARRSTENCVTAAPGTGNDVITVGAYRRPEVTTKVGTPTQGASRKPAADPKLRRRREPRRVRLPREPGRDRGRGGPCSHSTGREAVRFCSAAGSPRTLRKASRTARSKPITSAAMAAERWGVTGSVQAWRPRRFQNRG